MELKFIDLPSPNCFSYKMTTRAVVLHGTAGAVAPSLNWLRSTYSNVSANYVISKTGVVYRLVDPERGRSAWCNGIIENYDRSIKWLNDAVAGGVNPNLLTISIEHEASKEEMEQRRPMTDAQFNASINLTAYLLKKNNLRASHQTIIGHNQISGTNKYNCPGVIFPPAYTEVLIMRYSELA